MKLLGLRSFLSALMRSPGAAHLKSDPPRDGLLRGEPEQMAHLHGSFVCFFFAESVSCCGAPGFASDEQVFGKWRHHTTAGLQEESAAGVLIQSPGCCLGNFGLKKFMKFFA